MAFNVGPVPNAISKAVVARYDQQPLTWMKLRKLQRSAALNGPTLAIEVRQEVLKLQGAAIPIAK